MEDKCTGNAYADGENPAPPPIRNNAKGEYRETSQ